MDRNGQMATRTSDLGDNVARVATDQIGPRRPGVVYYDGPALVEVGAVWTGSDRVLKAVA